MKVTFLKVLREITIILVYVLGVGLEIPESVRPMTDGYGRNGHY